MADDRMFKNVERWNPVTGCTHRCLYFKKDATGKRKPMCWARKVAEGRASHSPRYKDGFDTYKINDSEFHRLKEHTAYFVCSMGDLWAADCPETYRDAVLTFLDMEDGRTELPNCPETTTLLFLTKNPRSYKMEWPESNIVPPENYVFGATIETNRDRPGHENMWENAPTPTERIEAMKDFRKIHPEARLFLSIEPIMEFDLMDFVRAILDIRPEWVYVGLDNHHGNLPEPEEREIWELVYMLAGFTEPRIKGRLSRIND